MTDFLAFFLPLLAFMISPILIPLIVGLVGTAKDVVAAGGSAR